MNKIRTIILVITALLITSFAHAQINLGGAISVDSDRVEAAIGVSFSMAAYTDKPPARGFDSPDLIGFYSTSTGQYPMLPQGTWVKICVFPNGFKNLQGVDYDPSGTLQRDAREGWEPMQVEEGGGYSVIIRIDRLSSYPIRFRMRHRDGRDRYTLLIFTATWVRGGNLPSYLEIMVQRWPIDRRHLRGEEMFPYLRGFYPATATAAGQMTTQEQTIPGQTASATADPTQGNNGGQPPANNGNYPTLGPPSGGQGGGSQQQFAPFGVAVSARHSDPVTAETVGQVTGFFPVPEPGVGSSSTTTIPIDLNRPSMVVRFESAQLFTVAIRLRDGNVSQAKVERTATGYVCLVFGRTASFLEKGIELVVSQGQRTRTIRFGRKQEN